MNTTYKHNFLIGILFFVINTFWFSACMSANARSDKKTQKIRTYTMYWNIQKDPPSGLTVEVHIPQKWKQKLDPMGSPIYEGNGISFPPTIVLLPAQGKDNQEKLERLLSRMYEKNNLTTAERRLDPNGKSVWIIVHRDDGYIDARFFTVAPQDLGAVSCVIILNPKESGRLEELIQIFTTLRITTK